MTNPQISILIVEDSPPQAFKLKLALKSNGCHVDWADTGLVGLDTTRQKHFDLIVLSPPSRRLKFR